MKKILIIALVLVLVAGGIFFYTRNQNTNQQGSNTTGGLLSLFPFGKNQTTSSESEISVETPITTEDNSTATSSILPRMRQLSSAPVAGVTGISKERPVKSIPSDTTATTQDPGENNVLPTTELVDYVRYIEKSTGHVYDIAIDEASSVRVTNTTIPRINEAFFTNNGKGVLVRYLENATIKTWSGTIVTGQENTAGKLTGSFLDDDISSIALSPDTGNIAYIKDIGDTTYGYTSTTSGESKKQIFDSSFSEWLLQWSRTDDVALTTKATGFLEGYAYNIAGNAWKKITGPTFGLTRNADTQGVYSLISYTTARGTGLQSLNEKTGEKNILPINTFPEKCVWEQNMAIIYCAVPVSQDARTYPDDWYQGLYFSTDTIWRFDVISGVGTLIAQVPTEFGVLIDGINLGITPNKKMLYFINKRDNTLWGITL